MHTMEPWSVRELGEDCFITAAIEPGMPYGPEIMGDDYTGYGGEERKKADARRIVACVNACAGISTEALEACRSGGERQGELERKMLEKQRDALLAAAEKFIHAYRTGGPILPGVLENALASVKAELA